MPPMNLMEFLGHDHEFEYSRLNGGVADPPTGIGGFHVKYRPRQQELLITTKMYMTYRPDPTTPVMVGTAPYWTDSVKREFELAFQTRAAEFWSGKRAFECINVGFKNLRAVPKVQVEFVDAAPGAHFTVEVFPGAGQSHLNQDGSLTLYSLDVHSNYERKKKEVRNTKSWYQKTYAQARTSVSQAGSVMAVLMSEADKVIAALAPYTPITFAADSSALTPDSQGRLSNIARVIKDAHPDDPKFPLLLTAHYDQANEREAVAKARGRACKDRLVGQGVKRDFEIVVQSTVDPAKRYTVAVGVDNRPASLPNLVLKGHYKYRYTIAVHEFGHVLGVPDEYMLYNSPGYAAAIQNSHATWQTLCNAAHVARNACGDGPQFMTNSIMSHGTVLHDCHYVTMWDALCKATAHTIPADDWRIVPS